MVGSRIGQYVVLERIGQGGMGEVYLAHDAALDRQVALKFLNPDLLQQESARRRFVAEAKAAAALDHPFVCKVFETGEADGRPYFAMEYVAGSTLKDRLAQGPIPLDEAARIAAEIVEALESAHEHGLVHRDLKPSNIMLSSTGHVQVMDFGLAKRLPTELGDQAQTLTASGAGSTAGTLAYMSPEQLRAGTVDARADMFAMGIVLFEMLTGRHPFIRESGIETAGAILNDAFPPLEGLLGETGRPWQPVLERMLAKDRERRYSSMYEVRSVLAELRGVSHPPQPARRLGWHRLRMLRPRRRRVMTALGAVAFAAVLLWIYVALSGGPRTALAFQARDWILVADFDNQTGDPVFDKSLRAALMVGIQQSSYVNVFPDARIQQTLRRMRKQNVQKLDEDLAGEVALREGIKGILVCGISKIGDVYSLTARLVDPVTRATAATQAARARGKDEVLPALDSLARQVRERLGESLSRIPGRAVPLLRATTSSLEALKAYVDGSLTTDPNKAATLMQHAVELDPEFALAHIQLGQACYIRGNGASGEVHFKKALGLLARLTLREQLWVQAVVEDWRGNREVAVNRYKNYVDQYPDDAWAWFRMGWAQMATLRQYGPAIESFNRSIELHPASGTSYVNLATCYAALKEYPEAIATYQKAFHMDPYQLQDANVMHEYGFVLVRVGETVKARSAFESLLKRDDSDKSRGHRSLALLDMYQGKYRSAVMHLREAILLNQAAKVKNSELRDRLYLAAAFHTLGQSKERSAELKQVERMLAETRFAPSWLALAAKVFARAGNTRVVAALSRDLATRLHDPTAVSYMNRSEKGDRAALHHLEGIAALSRGRMAEALESLNLSVRLEQDELALDSLASAYAAAGQTEEAIRRYRELIDGFGLGNEAQECRILAHYELGKLHERRRELAKAKEYYQTFLDLWKEADAELRAAADARKRLAKL